MLYTAAHLIAMMNETTLQHATPQVELLLVNSQLVADAFNLSLFHRIPREWGNTGSKHEVQEDRQLAQIALAALVVVATHVCLAILPISMIVRELEVVPLFDCSRLS